MLDDTVIRWLKRHAVPITAALALGLGSLLSTPLAHAADAFRMLKGPAIRAGLSGMELTDDVHWAYVFGPNGTLTVYSTGRKSAGRWSVQKDQLCLDTPVDHQRCYAVWRAGKTLQLRQPEFDIYDEGLGFHVEARVLVWLVAGDGGDALDEIEDALGRSTFLDQHRVDDFAALGLREAAAVQENIAIGGIETRPTRWPRLTSTL